MICLRSKAGIVSEPSDLIEPRISMLIEWLQYSDSGWYTCAGYPGSFENEDRDVKTFQDWGFEFLK